MGGHAASRSACTHPVHLRCMKPKACTALGWHVRKKGLGPKEAQAGRAAKHGVCCRPRRAVLISAL